MKCRLLQHFIWVFIFCHSAYLWVSIIHTGEEPYTKSVKTGEEPHIHDIIVLSFIKKQFTNCTPCRIHWLKWTILFAKSFDFKYIATCNSMFKYYLVILFYSVNWCWFFIYEHHLYCIKLGLFMSVFYNVGVKLLFFDLACSWRTLWSMILLNSLRYTISWSWHQNMATLVWLGCNGNGWATRFHRFIVKISCFFNNFTQDTTWWYATSWPCGAVTLGFANCPMIRNHLNMFSLRKV